MFNFRSKCNLLKFRELCGRLERNEFQLTDALIIAASMSDLDRHVDDTESEGNSTVPHTLMPYRPLVRSISTYPRLAHLVMQPAADGDMAGKLAHLSIWATDEDDATQIIESGILEGLNSCEITVNGLPPSVLKRLLDALPVQIHSAAIYVIDHQANDLWEVISDWLRRRKRLVKLQLSGEPKQFWATHSGFNWSNLTSFSSSTEEPDDLVALTNHLPRNLRKLTLTGANVGDAGLASITNHLKSACLSSLNLGGIQCSGEAIAELMSQLETTQLTDLDLSGNAISNRDLVQIGKLLPPTIRGLDLSSTGLTAVGLRNLCGNPALANLEEFAITSAAIGGQIHECFAAMSKPMLPKALVMVDCNLETDDFKCLAKQGIFSQLQYAYFCNNTVDSVACQYFQAAEDSLEYLDLSACEIGDLGAETLAKMDWKKLTALDLYFCGITDSGAIQLAHSSSLASLRQLSLTGKFGDKVLDAISESKSFPNLVNFCLSDTEASDSSLHRFGKSPTCRLLDYLSGFGNDQLTVLQPYLRRCLQASV